MAINIQLNDGVRFFDNGREIVVVTAVYAPKYLKAKAYSNKEVFEVADLATQIADGRPLSFWSGSIRTVQSDSERLCLRCMNNFISIKQSHCSECEYERSQVQVDAQS